jgi:hypothetical protein
MLGDDAGGYCLGATGAADDPVAAKVGPEVSDAAIDLRGLTAQMAGVVS